MSRFNKNLLDIYIYIYIVLSCLVNCSDIIITAHNSVEGKEQRIRIIDGCRINIKKSDNNIILSQGESKLYGGIFYYYYFSIKPGTYEITITTNKNQVSLVNLLRVEYCHFDSIAIKNKGKITITDLSHVFYDCKYLKSIDLSMLDMSTFTNFTYIFNGCSGLVSVNFGNLLPQKLKDMSFMFFGCSNLISINLSNFDTSNVIDMRHMFYQCSSLKSINLSYLDTSNVIDMRCMFYGCSNLTSINLSNFDTSNAIEISWMFYQCSSKINKFIKFRHIKCYQYGSYVLWLF